MPGRKWFVFALALALTLLMGSPLWAAPLVQDNVVVVTYPTSGTTVSGIVQILGTVTHPNFDRYSLYYAPGPAATATSQWQPIVLDVRQQVVNGVLAQWDTTAIAEDGSPLIPNGVYHMVLIRYRQDGATDSFFVNNIIVQNEFVTPTPTPTEEVQPFPTPVAETPTPALGEGPPTPTPSPTATPRPGAAVTPTPTARSGGRIQIDTAQMVGAFLRGARITLLLFGLWGLYLLVKAGFRYYLRTRRRREWASSVRRWQR